MQSRAPLMASAKLAASPEWNEPIRPETLKHRRFIWATQFGTGSSGASVFKTKARQRHRSLAERDGAAAAAKARCEANRLRNLAIPKVI